MSNLQDVPLADPEGLPTAVAEESAGSKTSSLKRFFKLSKKPALQDHAVKPSKTSIEGDNKELGKSNTLSRIFARKKATPRDGLEQSSSVGIPIEKDKPLANPKPAIKASMSMYWKRLFHLHKTQNQEAGSGADKGAVNGPEEVHELQLVQNDPENPTTDLEQPDLDANQESEPQTVSEKATASDQILSALESGHRLAVESKDGTSGQL